MWIEIDGSDFHLRYFNEETGWEDIEANVHHFHLFYAWNMKLQEEQIQLVFQGGESCKIESKGGDIIDLYKDICAIISPFRAVSRCHNKVS